MFAREHATASLERQLLGLVVRRQAGGSKSLQHTDFLLLGSTSNFGDKADVDHASTSGQFLTQTGTRKRAAAIANLIVRDHLLVRARYCR